MNTTNDRTSAKNMSAVWFMASCADGGLGFAQNALGPGVVGDDDNDDGNERNAEDFHGDFLVCESLNRFDDLLQNEPPENDDDQSKSEKQNPMPRVLCFRERLGKPCGNGRLGLGGIG
jgi:hypothetical protein